jgi:hypothetical protein
MEGQGLTSVQKQLVQKITPESVKKLTDMIYGSTAVGNMDLQTQPGGTGKTVEGDQEQKYGLFSF